MILASNNTGNKVERGEVFTPNTSDSCRDSDCTRREVYFSVQELV